MREVVGCLKDRVSAKPASKVLLALCLAERNRRVAVEVGAVGMVVEALSDLEGPVAERALAALELLCTVEEGAAEVRSHALAVLMMVEVMGRMEGRGKEYAISVLSVIYGSGSPDHGAAIAPPEEVARAVMLALQGTSETQVFNEQSPSGKDYLAEDGFPLESMQRVCTLEAELALLLRISYKYRKSGAQVLFSMDALEHISSCKALKMQIKGSHHRFETKFGRELSVDVDKQRMVIAPILRLVFSLASLVDTSEFFQVSNKVVRGVLEFIRGHALLFDQILREDLSGADELTMEQMWPYEESDDYGFVQGLFTMMRVIFSLDLDSFISNKSMCYIEMGGMSESEFNKALNIELKHIIEVLSL
nr:nuclear pore complex protein NUP205 [Ipomoea batatas]